MKTQNLRCHIQVLNCVVLSIYILPMSGSLMCHEDSPAVGLGLKCCCQQHFFVGYLKQMHSDFTPSWLCLFVKQKNVNPAESHCQASAGAEMGSEVSRLLPLFSFLQS